MSRHRKYRNAITSGTIAVQPLISGSQPEEKIEDSKWYQITDNILNIADRGVDIFNEAKYGPSASGSTGTSLSIGREDEGEKGIFGIKKPWGAIIIIGFVGIVGFAVYKMNKK